MNVNITKESFFNRLTQFIKENNFPRLPYGMWKKIYDLITDQNLEISKTYSNFYMISASYGTYLARNIATIHEQPINEATSISDNNHIGSYVLYEFCKMLETQNIAKEVIKSPKPTVADVKIVLGSEFLDKLVDYCDETHYDYAEETRLFQRINKNKHYKITRVQEKFSILCEVACLNNAILDSSHTSVKENFIWWNTFFDKFFEPKWITENKNINNTTKGEKEMKGFNIEFGSCEKDNVRLSMYGLAVKNASGEWVSYDAKTESIINVDIFNFGNGKFLYKMPVAFKDITPGDLLIHNKKPVFVTSVEDGIKAIDIMAGEKKEVLLTRNMFNFEYATKVVSLFTMTNASSEQPFGNMLPLLMLEESNGNASNILPFLMMQGNMDFSNPMMMYFLMKDGGNDDAMLPLFLMMNANGCNKKD